MIELLHSLIETLHFEYPQAVINLKAPSTALLIKGYPDSLAQALENIIRNACKYSPEGSAIELTVSEAENGVVIAVRDHGQGVAETDLARLLQPFYRAGNKMHTPGFGLGLSIAQRAINKHKGVLSIRNHVEGGLLVCVELPLAQSK